LTLEPSRPNDAASRGRSGDDGQDAGDTTGAATIGPPGSRRRSVAWLLGVGAAVLLADLVTKQLTVSLLTGAEPVRLLGGAVYLVYATNSGAAFSIGSSYTFVFSLFAVAVIAWIGWMAWGTRSLPWAVALGLVLGGATGNLGDRLFRPPGPLMGEVVDMVSLFDPAGRVWPVFNVADSALLVGVALAVWLELTGRRRDGTRVSGGRR
jgi:signal peptidase II